MNLLKSGWDKINKNCLKCGIVRNYANCRHYKRLLPYWDVVQMIPKIKSVKPLKGYLLHVIFDDGKDYIYDVNDDINVIEEYKDLKTIHGLFEQVQLDESRTCVFWNDFIDLPSDAIREHGKSTAMCNPEQLEIK